MKSKIDINFSVAEIVLAFVWHTVELEMLEFVCIVGVVVDWTCLCLALIFASIESGE